MHSKQSLSVDFRHPSNDFTRLKKKILAGIKMQEKKNMRIKETHRTQQTLQKKRTIDIVDLYFYRH